jgi:Mlc titration factor MtfA (ptsG expression regulator)
MIVGWLRTLKERRDARTLERRPIPDDLWRLTLARLPFLAVRPEKDTTRLRELATLFLAAKEFSGPVPVTDEMAVAIAAQACLPVLELGLHWYDGFVGIVIHADAVQVRREVQDDDGVVHEYDEELSGEAMDGGPVMLSWRDVADAGESAAWGYNVVIHEFAHVIDFRAGLTRGALPPSSGDARAHWLAALDERHAQFCDEVDHDDETFLDPYGAQGLEEFFAVASEAFFVMPRELKADDPGLYALLARFYLQDPAQYA